MSLEVIPRRSSQSWSAWLMPPQTWANWTPREVSAWGSKKISACRTDLGCRPFEVCGDEVVEVLFSAEYRHSPVIDVQEPVQAGQPVGGPGFVRRVEEDGDVVPGC